jgi:choline-sulfatase
MRRLLDRVRRERRPLPGDRPNLLLVMTDQQRWDGLGCVGGWVQTPAMDGLAAEGVRFANAYTNSPACVPARVSAATGRYPHQHGVWRNAHYTLPEDEPTWMRAVRDAGYRTSLFGKAHLHPHRGDLRDRAPLLQALGLDVVDEVAGPRASARSRSNLTDLWEQAGVYEPFKRDLRDRLDGKAWVARPSPLPLELYPDVYVGRQAAAHLRALPPDQPWMCWVSFGGPHEPWDAPEPYASRYDPSTMPPPRELVEDPPERPRGVLDRRFAATVPFEPGDVARLRANYAGNLALIDDQVRDVLAAVQERGELDRTAVVLVSDHGEMNGDYGLLYKQNFLDPAVRVPFVVRLPGEAGRATAGAVAQAPVELMDLGATLVELAGARPVAGSSARSVVPVVRDPAHTHRPSALSEYAQEHLLVTREWKLARNRRGRPYLLFDLDADPQESRNLVGSRAVRAVQRDLMQQLQGRLDDAR